VRTVVALSRPALAAAAGAATLFLVTALVGTPNLPLAVAFFLAFFLAAALQFVDQPQSRPNRSWRASAAAMRTPMLRRTERVGGTMAHGPFDRFDERAKRVLSLAQDEAIRLNHNYIGTEHLLLGLLREGEGVAARVLESLGVELSKLRTAMEFTIGRGETPTVPAQITLSPRTKKVIELAIDEARKLESDLVGTEHLLLGLVREGEGIASGMLQSLNISLGSVRREVFAVLGKQYTEPPTDSPSASHPFDRFSHRAKRVLALSQDEAVRLGHNYIGTEHLLLGLVREGEGAAARALTESAVTLEPAREAVEFILKRGDAAMRPSEITLTPRMKKIFEMAVDEADRMQKTDVGTGHLLIALVREGGGVAVGILDSMKVDRDHLITRTREKITQGLG
jgi:ATP-dependent Clp protease ATP-binding subunit ClpA